MIDNFSGRHYGFCHRRHAVIILFFFIGQVKSPILHNTRDVSDFYVPYLSHDSNFRGGLWVGWEEGEEESHTVKNDVLY